MQNNYPELIPFLSLPQIIFYCFLAASAAAMLIHYLRSEKPVRTALLGMLSGTAALLLVNRFGSSIPFLVPLPLNGLTAFIALTLGIPGVAAMIIISLLI